MSSSESQTTLLQPVEQPASQKILQAILDTAREGVLVVDSEMRIAAANRSAAEAFCRNGAALENQRLSEVIRDPDLHGAFTEALLYDRPSDLKVEFTAMGKRTYDTHVAPIDLDGARNAIGVFYDITQVERLETVRQEFLSNISHELRTPLTAILAFVETLEDGAIDEKENNRRFLAIIRRNAERMHNLIADILELSMIESGNVSVEIRDVRLHDMVGEIFTSLSAKAETRNVRLCSDVPAAAVIRADPARLEQMLTNLVDNAIKFNRSGGSVTVGVRPGPGRKLISVADCGEGIVPEHLQRIFERFYRGDRGRSRDAGGTGLGLAIVKHLARLHGGEISVTSALGKGSVFTIELPI